MEEILAQTFDIPKRDLGGPTIEYPRSNCRLIPCQFTAFGLDDNGCNKVEIQLTYTKADGTPYDSGVISVPVTNGQWEYNFDLSGPGSGTGGKLTVKCIDPNSVAGDIVVNLEFTCYQILIRPIVTIDPAAGSLATPAVVFEVDHPKATGRNQSEVIVINHYDEMSRVRTIHHQHYPNIQRIRTIRIDNTRKGRYVAAFYFIDGTRECEFQMRAKKVT